MGLASRTIWTARRCRPRQLERTASRTAEIVAQSRPSTWVMMSHFA